MIWKQLIHLRCVLSSPRPALTFLFLDHYLRGSHHLKINHAKSSTRIADITLATPKEGSFPPFVSSKYVKANAIKEGSKSNENKNYYHWKNMIRIKSSQYRSTNSMSTSSNCQIGSLSLHWVVNIIIF